MQVAVVDLIVLRSCDETCRSWRLFCPATDCSEVEMVTYKVFLQRVDPKAGPSANFSFQVQAQNAQMAKVTAEAQYPGYRCINSPVRVG